MRSIKMNKNGHYLLESTSVISRKNVLFISDISKPLLLRWLSYEANDSFEMDVTIKAIWTKLIRPRHNNIQLTGKPSQSESLSSSSSSYFCIDPSLYVWLFNDGEPPAAVWATIELANFELSLTFSLELFRRFNIDITSVFLRLMPSASTVLADDDVAALTFNAWLWFEWFDAFSNEFRVHWSSLHKTICRNESGNWRGEWMEYSKLSKIFYLPRVFCLHSAKSWPNFLHHPIVNDLMCLESHRCKIETGQYDCLLWTKMVRLHQ